MECYSMGAIPEFTRLMEHEPREEMSLDGNREKTPSSPDQHSNVQQLFLTVLADSHYPTRRKSILQSQLAKEKSLQIPGPLSTGKEHEPSSGHLSLRG